MEDSIVERVVVLMEYYGLTASAFADKIDVQRSSMSHLVSGRNKPSLDFIQKVLTNFSDINPTWLIMGTGPMKQLDLFDIKGDVAPPEPIPAEKFRSAAPVAVAEQTVIRQSFQQQEPATEESGNIVYAHAAAAAHVAQIPEPVYIAQPVTAPVQAVPVKPSVVQQETIPAAVIPPVAAPQVVAPPVQQSASTAPAPATEPHLPAEAVALAEKSVQNDKKVVKIVFFYSDNTFETFNPQ